MNSDSGDICLVAWEESQLPSLLLFGEVVKIPKASYLRNDSPPDFMRIFLEPFCRGSAIFYTLTKTVDLG